jgi:nitroimidazol reductase NimA-like FMN-containing flavoprotein (pyridoxamine 5'-phosphate oxidase superfamily)
MPISEPSPATGAQPEAPPSPRSAVRRQPDRASYDHELAYAILDEGLVGHMGISTDDGPVVIPMMYARDDDRLLVHGSPASRLLRHAPSNEVCFTVTLVDGLVLARSAFHHSLNYRSVVVFGRPERIEDLEKRRAAQERLVEAVIPGRMADTRPPNEREVRGTAVLSLPLDECSVKLRTGGPVDEPEDYDLPVWAGTVPLSVAAGEPVPDPQHAPIVGTPPYVHAYRSRRQPEH